MTKSPAVSPAKPARPQKTENQAVATGQTGPEDLQSIFGENLKAARLKLGLTQVELADQAGVTQQRVAMIEGGDANVTIKTMMRLAQAVDGNVTSMLRRSKSRSAKE